MTLSLPSRARLHNGTEIPYLGLGVYQSPPGEITQAAVRYALEIGYRHIDTAAIYGNEADVGQALRDSGLRREEVFVTTKLWNSDQGYPSALIACERSLQRLGLEYVDLYLIHWPVSGQRLDSWRALVELQQAGRCRAIGVSNFTLRHLDELLSASDVVPTVNQVEFSPFLYQKELLDYCRNQGIQLEAYSPLTQGERLDDPMVGRIAAKHGKSPAQILIRWALEHEVVVIPKSITPARIHENADIFDFALDVADMAALDALNEDFRTCWDPTGLP